MRISQARFPNLFSDVCCAFLLTYFPLPNWQRCQSIWDGRQTTNLEAHHKEFRSQSGHDSEQNLITLCNDCHASVHY